MGNSFRPFGAPPSKKEARRNGNPRHSLCHEGAQKTSTGIAGGFSFSGCKPSYYWQRASRACDDLAVTHLLLVTRKRVVQIVYAHLA